MNQEIKEILDYFKTSNKNKKRIEKDKILKFSEAQVLLKYIINLQQENERLKEQNIEWKDNHKALCIQRDNILDNIVKDIEERIDYKSRCEKALYLIKHNDIYDYRVFEENLKNILNGDD